LFNVILGCGGVSVLFRLLSCFCQAAVGASWLIGVGYGAAQTFVESQIAPLFNNRYANTSILRMIAINESYRW
jgi:hypothetical protein